VRKTILVCYDIANAKRLGRVAKTMKGFGDRVQKSVFECQFNDTDMVRCRTVLSTIIDHRKDQILFVNLGPSEGRGDRVISSLGKPYSTIDASSIIV
jgi:CRISPR-associated protein Cas2